MNRRVLIVEAVFDGEPGVDGSKFVEVEDDMGHLIGVGEWVVKKSGGWELRVPITLHLLNTKDGWIAQVKTTET